MDETDKDSFLTLEAPSEGFFRNKGSRFLAYAFPVSTEPEIKELLSEIRKKYFDARHHCYAWRLQNGLYRANDDGEPSGTAGRPILGQIDAFGLTNVCVVVVRYFGGVLLGTGGLVEAYKKSAASALENGNMITSLIMERCKISFPYEKMGEVMRLMKESEVSIETIEQQMQCTMVLSVRKRLKESFSERLKLILLLRQNWE